MIALTLLRSKHEAFAGGQAAVRRMRFRWTPPGSIKLLRWGENPSTKGSFIIGDESAELLPLNARLFKSEIVQIDYEHGTCPSSPEYALTKDPRPVAGCGVPRVVLGDGLWLCNVQWTPEGRANAAHYPGLSPAIHTDDRGEVTWLHSVALVGHPAVFGLGFPEGLHGAVSCYASMVASGGKLSTVNGRDGMRQPALL